MEHMPDASINARAACMAVGDPNSPFSEAMKDEIAQGILGHMQSAPEAAELWETLRHEFGSEEERTVHDLTVADVRSFCEKVFWAVSEGIIPDPMEELREVLHTQFLPDVAFTTVEQQQWDALSSKMVERLVAGGFVRASEDGTELKTLPDTFVLLATLAANLGEQLDLKHYHAEANILDATAHLAIKLYGGYLRDRNRMN